MIIKIGHRGAGGLASENTIKSFQKALELKVDAVELDVHVCKTGELVVIHDKRVDRTTDGCGYVAERSLEELKEMDAGEGEKIPTLREVLDFINRRVKLYIELKGDGTAKSVYNLIQDYVDNTSWEYSDFVVLSFDHYELRFFKQMMPFIKTGAAISGIPIDLAEFADKAKADSVSLCVDFVNRRFVEDAYKRGLGVYIWTVNNSEDIARIKELGVEGIFSDFPDRF